METIDFVDGIEYDNNNPPLENTQAAFYLSKGIKSLAMTVRKEELEIYGSTQMYFGPINPVVNCCFDWFVISLTNYIRIVGLVEILVKKGWKTEDIVKSEQNRKEIKKHCSKYVENVVPELVKWRNKISAHPAATDPRKEDNVATIEYSLMSLVTYFKPYFCVGHLNYGKKGSTSDLPYWALTELYEKLIPRYWPNQKLQGFE